MICSYCIIITSIVYIAQGTSIRNIPGSSCLGVLATLPYLQPDRAHVESTRYVDNYCIPNSNYTIYSTIIYIYRYVYIFYCILLYYYCILYYCYIALLYKLHWCCVYSWPTSKASLLTLFPKSMNSCTSRWVPSSTPPVWFHGSLHISPLAAMSTRINQHLGPILIQSRFLVKATQSGQSQHKDHNGLILKAFLYLNCMETSSTTVINNQIRLDCTTSSHGYFIHQDSTYSTNHCHMCDWVYNYWHS